jgi:hypothetical protein
LPKKKSAVNADGTYKKLIKEIPEFNTPPKGEQWSYCEKCGDAFEQYLVAEQNRYTSFKKCPNCRQAHRKKQPDNLQEFPQEIIKAQLEYTPHATQALFHESKARFRVLNCGARWGKDRASTMESIKNFLELLNEERPTSMVPSVYWWIIAPTEKMAKQNWNELKKYFPKEFIVDVSNSTMTMQTVYGGLIEVRSAYDPESLVGVGLDIVTITEAARIADLDIVWANIEQRLNSPGRGLNGKGGIGIINSSPKGRNYFYKMWTWGQENHPDYDPDWQSWTFTTWDNPEMAVKGDEIKTNKFGIALTYKERLRRRWGDRRYRQDALAEFLAEEYNCFPNFEANCVLRLPAGLTKAEKLEKIREWREPKPYCVYSVGYDPASINDKPTLVVIEQETNNVVRLIDMKGLGWNQQYDKILEICLLYNNAVCTFGRTGHETINEELQKRGIATNPLNEQGGNKQSYINDLECRVESGLLHILYDESDEAEEYILQFNDYSAIQRGKSVEFTNVDQPHDDWVSATYFACQGISKPKEVMPAMGLMSGIRIARR